MAEINELRFVERDGKKILQQYVQIYYNTPHLYGPDEKGNYVPHVKVESEKKWRDIPFVSNEDLQN